MATELFNTPLFSDANLVAYYRLENVNDSKGSNNLTNNNSVAFNPAVFNNGADFGAANTNKSLSIASSLTYGGASWTVSFWMKLNAEIASGQWWPFQLGDNGSQTRIDFFYEYNSGAQQIRAGRTKTGISNDFVTIAGALGASAFHHFAITYNGSTVTVYMDGASKGTASSSGGGSSAETSAFYIGAATSSINFASVIVDDFAHFSRSLTAIEVANIFNGFGSGLLMSDI